MRKSKYTKSLLEPIVKGSLSWAEVIKFLGLKITGGNYRNIQGHVRHHEIDTSHFKGQGWSKGETAATDERVNIVTKKISYTAETALIENYPGKLRSQTLRRLFLETDVEYKCVNGHDAEWMGQPITLHIDHKNGINNDNRVENLRFLCPNCHQQTTTWGNKNNSVGTARLELACRSVAT